MFTDEVNEEITGWIYTLLASDHFFASDWAVDTSFPPSSCALAMYSALATMASEATVLSAVTTTAHKVPVV
jgi:hypothetical protein